MKEWSTEKIVSVGLTISLIVTVLGADAVAVMNGNMEIAGLAKEIGIGLLGYIGRGGVQTIDRKECPKNDSRS